MYKRQNHPYYTTFFQANHSINYRNQLYFISVFIYTCIKVKLTKGRKRDSFAQTKPNQTYRLSLLAAKFICAPGVIKAEQNNTLAKDKTPRLEPENIRESTLNFTARFGEINPNMLYLCRRGSSGPERAVFASFPSVRREPMKKIVKSSIFCEKTSKFLMLLSFKT